MRGLGLHTWYGSSTLWVHEARVINDVVYGVHAKGPIWVHGVAFLTPPHKSARNYPPTSH